MYVFEQLCVPVELYATGAVGDRLRDGGRPDPADHPPEQVPVSGPARRPEGGLVSRTT